MTIAQTLQNVVSDSASVVSNTKTGFPKIPGVGIQATYGWWLFVGCIGSILLANTPLAPGVLAVMSIASLYQLENLVQGK